MGYDLRTQRGYDFYEVASALQKSIRRGDVKLAGYMALELFPRYAEYCWKRLLTISAEDCHGLVTQEIKALYDSFHVVNKGKRGEELKGRIFISKAVIILCKQLLSDEEIERAFEEARSERMEIPDYVYDCHTRKGKAMGRTKQQFFEEEDRALSNKQLSIFDGVRF